MGELKRGLSGARGPASIDGALDRIGPAWRVPDDCYDKPALVAAAETA